MIRLLEICGYEILQTAVQPCVKCGLNNNKNNPLACWVVCYENHTTNYKGCSEYLKLSIKQNALSNSIKVQMLKAFKNNSKNVFQTSNVNTYIFLIQLLFQFISSLQYDAFLTTIRLVSGW